MITLIRRPASSDFSTIPFAATANDRVIQVLPLQDVPFGAIVRLIPALNGHPDQATWPANAYPPDAPQPHPPLAQSFGFMSHNAALILPYIHAWAAALEQAAHPYLQGPTRLLLHFPHAEQIDPNAMQVLRIWAGRLAELRKEQPPEIAARFPGLWFEFAETDEANDWLWGREVQAAAHHLAMLQALPGTKVWLDQEPERHALPDHALLAAATLAPFDSIPTTPPADEAELAQRLAQCEQAFSVFGFRRVLRLGQALAVYEPLLSPGQRARLYTLLGLAAYNRQVRSENNAPLAEYLQTCFETALANETNPAHRSHLLYRLCINSGRRQGDLPHALALANQAVAEARHPDVAAVEADFLEAWALNGRAYLHARMKNLVAGNADCLRAQTLLEELHDAPAALAEEIKWARVVMFDNAAQLAQVSKDIDLMIARQTRYEQREREAIGTLPRMRLSPFRWMRIARLTQDWSLGLQYARDGFDNARQLLDPLGEDFFASQAAEFALRAARWQEARNWLEFSRSVRIHLAAEPARLTIEINDALLALADGDTASAAARAQALLTHPLCEKPEAKAEVRCLQARIAAAQGDGATCDGLIDQAIEAALETGMRDSLLRVALAGGETCLQLGRMEEASQAFAQAEDIMAAECEQPVPALLRLALLIGQLDCAGNQTGMQAKALAQALDCLPEALQAPDSALLLARLWYHAGAASTHPHFSLLERAVRTRPDCLP